jgi:hypothetical protein
MFRYVQDREGVPVMRRPNLTDWLEARTRETYKDRDRPEIVLDGRTTGNSSVSMLFMMRLEVHYLAQTIV